MTVPDDALSTLKPTPYSRVRAEVQDGDLLLCSAHDPMSKVIRWATRTQWSHVAMAFRIQSIDRVMVLESVEHFGVRTVPLSSFIRTTSSGVSPYPGRILLARHEAFHGPSATRRMKAAAEFGFSRLGDPFSNREMLKIVLRVLFGRLNRKMPRSLGPHDEFICSEFVARAYAKAGVKIAWDGLGFIGPGDIAADPKVAAVLQVRTR